MTGPVPRPGDRGGGVPSVHHTFTRLVRRWWLVAVLVLLGTLAGAFYAALSPSVYTARAHVVVVAVNPGDSAAAVGYAQAYSRIAVQGEVLDAAVRAGAGAESRDDLGRRVSVSSSPDAPVIEITGSAGSPDRAARVANLVAGGLIRAGNAHSADTRMKLSLLNAAVPPTDRTSPRTVLDLAVGACIGLLLGGLAVLAGLGGAGAGSATRTGPGPRHGNGGRGPVDGVPADRRWTGSAPVAARGPADRLAADTKPPDRLAADTMPADRLAADRMPMDRLPTDDHGSTTTTDL